MEKRKKIFGVLGNPLSHSKSPKLHNYWFKKHKLKNIYKKYEINEKQIPKLLKELKYKKINGLNVTIPYKKIVIKHLDKLEGNAKFNNSVNTIFLKKNKLIGENTDVDGINIGFLKNIKLKNKIIFIIGAGGVSLSLIWALKKKKLKLIYVTNRTTKEIVRLKKFFKVNIINWKNRNEFLKKADIIFNATSLGMKNYPEMKLNSNIFKKSSIYCEIIYNPRLTGFAKKLKIKNIKTLNGLDMFIEQARKSFKIWNGFYPDKLREKQINKIFR